MNEFDYILTDTKKDLSTDVSDLTCDDIVQKGTDKFPVFDVEEREFFQNMTQGRKRIRLSGKAGEYHRQTKYNRPFYVRYTDKTGHPYLKKIKE